MHQRRHLTGFFIAIFFTAGLLVRPPAAAAAGQTGSGFPEGFRIEQATDPRTERTEAKLSPLVLRLYGGFSQVEAGDINAGLDGYFEVFELYAAHGFGTTTGRYNPLRGAPHFGGDIVFQITPRIGLGIGAGYLRFSESSNVTWALTPEYSMEFSVRPTLSAIPIRAGVFLSLPLLGETLRLTLGAGAAAYAEIKLESTERLTILDGEWTERSFKASGGSPFDNVGFDGSLGLELRVSPRFGLFVEAVGRYARLKSFEKVAETARNNHGDSESFEGQLYLETFTFGEEGWSIFRIAETPPVSNPPMVVYTKPKIDLSGFSLQAGLRFRL